MTPITRPASVLLVESHQPTLDVLTDHVDQTHDITVATAATSIADALSAITTPSSAIAPSHDIAVVASTLSDGTAFDFLHSLDNFTIDLPSIVLSSTGLMRPEEFLAAGAVAHIYKQINGFNLLDTIRQATMGLQ